MTEGRLDLIHTAIVTKSVLHTELCAYGAVLIDNRSVAGGDEAAVDRGSAFAISVDVLAALWGGRR